MGKKTPKIHEVPSKQNSQGKKMALLELLAGDGTADLAKTYPATTN